LLLPRSLNVTFVDIGRLPIPWPPKRHGFDFVAFVVVTL